MKLSEREVDGVVCQVQRIGHVGTKTGALIVQILETVLRGWRTEEDEDGNARAVPVVASEGLVDADFAVMAYERQRLVFTAMVKNNKLVRSSSDEDGSVTMSHPAQGRYVFAKNLERATHIHVQVL